MHGANRLGGNSLSLSLSDLRVFGRRAGLHASEYVRALQQAPEADSEDVEALAREALRVFEETVARTPTPQQDLQECMQALVGLSAPKMSCSRPWRSLLPSRNEPYACGWKDTASTIRAGPWPYI
jgi:succinate dehydrogenase/fumarate reductase flavoprotein subunit